MVPLRLATPKVASLLGPCVREVEREPRTQCSCMCQVPLVTCIPLRYTKITVNLVLQVWSRVSLTKKLGGFFVNKFVQTICYFAAQDGEGALVAFI